MSSPRFPSFVEPYLANGAGPAIADGITEEWLRAVVTDPSYVPASASERDSVIIVLDALSALGAACLNLALIHRAFEYQLSARNSNDFVQRLKAPVTSAICARFDLVPAVLGGPGFARELLQEPVRQRVERDLVRRAVGALCLSGRYDVLFESVLDAVTSIDESERTIASYKTELQEYFDPRGQGPATYREVEASGPAHDRRFLIEVQLPDGRSARGGGRTKREAGEEAARAFLEAHASRHIESRKRLTRQPSQAHSPRVLHAPGALDQLARTLGVDASHLGALSVALAHPGTREGEPVTDLHRSLAQLGGFLIEVITRSLWFEELYDREPSELVKAELMLGRVREQSNSAHAFDLLSLDRAFIRPRNLELNERVRADVFQASIAATFLSNPSAEPDILAQVVRDHFRDRVAQGFGTPRERLHDPKTALQERLAALRMEWSYEVDAIGPPHSRTFTSHLLLRQPEGKGHVKLSGGKGASRREADKALAAKVLYLLDVVNEGLGVDHRVNDWSEPLRRTAAFLLRSAIWSTQTSEDVLALTRLANTGILGARLLTSGRLDDFRAWASRAQQLLEDAGYHVEASEVVPFYRHLRRIGGTDASRSYVRSVPKVAQLVGSLSPERYEGDLRQTEAFRELLDLANVARLSIQPVEVRGLSEIVDDLMLLRRGRPPRLSIETCDVDPEVVLPAGSLQALLSELVDRVGDAAEVRIAIEASPPRDVEITIASQPAPVDAAAGLVDIQRSPLWQLLAQKLASLEIKPSDGGARLVLKLPSEPSETRTLADEALAAFRSPEATEASEIQSFGTILHDLKNHLVAFHVALSGSSDERTARLRAQYEASRHLDAATALVHAAQTVGRALGRACPERLDIGVFFREYFAEKYATLPTTIELVAPPRTEGGEAWTDRSYLRSILDNIVKNAVEAMPDGGRITCEWVVDADRLLIEVTDDGPGIERDVLARMLAGQPVDSEKPEGSGIGMLTVKSMVNRLGGTMSGESSQAGTRWSIELPVEQPLARTAAREEGFREAAA